MQVNLKLAGLTVAAVVLAPGLAQALPDWSGVWTLQGGTVFDHASAVPPTIRNGGPGVREKPPFNAAWQAKYEANMKRVAADRFPDPITTCGTPPGFPRIMNLPDGYEFVVAPKQTWVLTENGPGNMRIYTDGRAHISPTDIWPTYTGDSVGHWEGDTLVFDTIGILGEKGAIVDRTGIVLSQKAHTVTRLHQIDADTLQADITIDDADAFVPAAKWSVSKQYKRQTGDVRIMDYSCAENNRNPILPNGKTLTLGSDGKPIDNDK